MYVRHRGLRRPEPASCPGSAALHSQLGIPIRDCPKVRVTSEPCRAGGRRIVKSQRARRARGFQFDIAICHLPFAMAIAEWTRRGPRSSLNRAGHLCSALARTNHCPTLPPPGDSEASYLGRRCGPAVYLGAPRSRARAGLGETGSSDEVRRRVGRREPTSAAVLGHSCCTACWHGYAASVFLADWGNAGLLQAGLGWALLAG